MSDIDEGGTLKLLQALEFLSPAALPVPCERHDLYSPYVYDVVELREALPWESEGRIASEEIPIGYVWQHDVIVYPFEMHSISEKLKHRFGDSSSQHLGRLPAAALLGFRVNASGEIDSQGVVLSTASWLFARADTAADESWNAEFLIAQDKLRKAAAEHLSGPVTTVDIARLSRWVIALLGLQSFFSTRRKSYRVVSTPTQEVASLRAYDLINSPFLHGLDEVKHSVESGTAGPALTGFLKHGSHGGGVDVFSPEAAPHILDSLLPRRYSQGCWPNQGGQDLNLTQQVAINVALQAISRSGGVVGIDAPAASGRMAIIRDLVANAVTGRADALASLRTSGQAFTFDKIDSLQFGHQELCPRNLLKGLLGHEVVIASTDVRMVRSMPFQLSGLGAVEQSMLDESPLLASIASSLNATPAWGMLTAALSPADHSDIIGARLASGPESLASWLGVCLENVIDDDVRQAIWDQAVGRYRAAKAHAKELIACLNDVESMQLDLARARSTLEQKNLRLEGLLHEVNALNEELQFLRKLARGKQYSDLMDLEIKTLNHEATRPTLGQSIKSFGHLNREWQSERSYLAENHGRAKERQDDIDAKLAKEEALLQQRLRVLSNCQEEVDKAKSQVQSLSNSVGDLAGMFGAKYLGDWAANKNTAFGTDFEKFEAWAVPCWRDARAKVFIEALELHKTFFQLEAEPILANMNVAIALLKGAELPELSSLTKSSAWATLFMAVPAVSVKLSDFGQCFKTLESEQLGWLLIDEAGRAGPAAAVSAIWRSKKVVCLGDGTNKPAADWVPDLLASELCRIFGADPAFNAKGLSIQQVAANCTALGSLVVSGRQSTWLGVPLYFPHRHNPKLKACYPHEAVAKSLRA
jgi:hypothetical protein